MRRRLDPELLDRDGWERAELVESLRLIADVNRRLGGVRLVTSCLSDLPSSATVLDVGTGNAEFLAGFNPRKAATAHHVGVDLHPQIVRVAAERRHSMDSVSVVRADARALPFEDGSFDAVVSMLMLHHFTRPDAILVLREMARVARSRVIVADLERTRVALLGARVLSRTVWRHNRLTRIDGPLSVQRAWTRGELTELADATGTLRARVTRHFPYGLLLNGTPEHAAPSGGAPA